VVQLIERSNMTTINDNYLKLKAGYLFPEIGRRVSAFAEANPDAAIIKLGIGDVTEPLPEACRIAMLKAVDDQGKHEKFHGYGPEQGYSWLRDAIVANDFRARGCEVSADEVFVSDGSKCDCGNILDVFAPGSQGAGNTIAVTDPVYPVYVDTNVMGGATGAANDAGEYDGLIYLRATEANGFTPPIPDGKVDLIYLCYPNNPTGMVATKAYLQQWVDYANANGSIILFDAAYEAFINDGVGDIPHSIFEVPGARTCAIEFRSFSKKAGFTGTRCGFTVVPKDLMGKDSAGNDVSIHQLWHRRQSTKFNGVSYIVQRGAEAVYSEAGRAQCDALVAFYMENAKLMRTALTEQGMTCFGGEHAPYLWVKTPGAPGSSDRLSSWDFFDKMLREAHIVGTPGSGFGTSGEGYFRLSAFNSRANVEEAIARIAQTVSV